MLNWTVNDKHVWRIAKMTINLKQCPKDNSSIGSFSLKVWLYLKGNIVTVLPVTVFLFLAVFTHNQLSCHFFFFYYLETKYSATWMCYIKYFRYYFYQSPTAFESFPVCPCLISPIGFQRYLMLQGIPCAVHPLLLNVFMTNPHVNISKLVVKSPL